MKFLINKKTIAIIIIAFLLLSGAVFTLGGYGSSGPSSAPNLAEYGLVGFWNMEEGKGQTVYDRSGNANNGTLGASTAVGKDDPVFTSGYSSAGPGGTGLKFDGKGDSVRVPNNSSFQPTTAITVEAWIKPDSIGVPDAVLGIAGSWVDGGYGFDFYNNDQKLRFWINDYTQNRVSTATAFPIGVWSHIVGTYDQNNVKLYVNGTLIGSDPYTSVITYQSWILVIGGLTGNAFNGIIDEVRIYNRALSADEIRQHYNQKKPILEWKFDEGSGTSTKDESFNNNDGTLHE